jgi:ABC-2 type transport system ATP-binding protein
MTVDIAAARAPLPNPVPPVTGLATAVATENLSRSFGPILAVDRISLSIAAGEIFGLLGPNGAGKTTTIKMLTTLLPMTSGSATVGGFHVAGHPRSVRTRIGYVPQLVSSDGSLTARENLRLAGRLYHLTRAEREESIARNLAFMGLTADADRMVRTYSGGMVRRLELAQALLHRPAVLFLDEPTVGLDPVARSAVWDHILRLRERDGTTIVLTTHYMDEAEALCDRVGVMHHGRLVALGTPDDLKAAIGPGASLEDVFAAWTDDDQAEGGTFRDTRRARRTASRLG